MKTAQPGDRVRVHYVKRFQDGAVASSRVTGPLELTVGVEHPRLPGLGMALVGMSPGSETTLTVPPEQGYGLADPNRVRRLARSRFDKDQELVIGEWVRVNSSQGRCRLVRVLEICDEATVLVDANHRGAGQTMQVHVKIVGIQQQDTSTASHGDH